MSEDSSIKTPLKPTILRFKAKDQDSESQSASFKIKQMSPDKKQLEETPTKNQSLKEAILSRVSASKSRRFAYSQQVAKSSAFEEFEDLKEQVIQNQNASNEGYYGFSQWLKINELTFPSHNKHCVEELWKILRIINFGEVSIPSGLIYQVLAILKSCISISEKQRELVSTINRFLELNEVKSNFYSLKQLNNYKPIPSIIANYTSDKVESSQNNTAKKANPHVFDELFYDAKVRSQKKTFNCIVSQKQSLRECTFVPFISNYATIDNQKQGRHGSQSSHGKRCTASSKKWRQQQVQSFILHKHLPLDRTIFQNKVEEIDGVAKHVKRTLGSYQERLRVKRMIQKPTVLKHRY